MSDTTMMSLLRNSAADIVARNISVSFSEKREQGWHQLLLPAMLLGNYEV